MWPRDGSGRGHRRRAGVRPGFRRAPVPGPHPRTEGAPRRHRARGPGHSLGPQGATRARAAHRRPPRLGPHGARRGTRTAGGGPLRGRCAARPPERARRHPRPRRAHRPRPAHRPGPADPGRRRRGRPDGGAPRGPRRPPGPAPARRRGRGRAGRRPAAGRPGVPGRRRVRRPADRDLGRAALHTGRARHQVGGGAAVPARRLGPDHRRSAGRRGPRRGVPGPSGRADAGRRLARRPSPGGRLRPRQATACRGRGGHTARPGLPPRIRRPADVRRPDAAVAHPCPGRPRRPAHRLRARRLLGGRRPRHPGRHRRHRPVAHRGLAVAAVRDPGVSAPVPEGPHRDPGPPRRAAARPRPDAGADRTAAPVLPGDHRDRQSRDPSEAPRYAPGPALPQSAGGRRLAEHPQARPARLGPCRGRRRGAGHPRPPSDVPAGQGDGRALRYPGGRR